MRDAEIDQIPCKYILDSATHAIAVSRLEKHVSPEHIKDYLVLLNREFDMDNIKWEADFWRAIACKYQTN